MTTALYYAPDACSLAPHIVLREIGKPFELRKVSVMTGGNLLPEYLAINPKGRIPALLTDGYVLTENPAILAHLGRKYPAAGLLPPENSESEARCLEMLAWLSNTVHVAFAQMVRPARFTTSEESIPHVQESGRAAFGRCLAEIDTQLGRRKFAAGSHYSVADPYLLVFFRWGVRHDFDMKNKFPSYSRFADALYERQAVREAIGAEGLTIWPEIGPPPP